MKLLIFLALLAIAHCVDNEDTPDIILGTWKFNSTEVLSVSPCCIPTGDLQITNNTNGTVTMTSPSWGGDCSGRIGDQELMSLDGSDSLNELTLNSAIAPYILTTNWYGKEIDIGITFTGDTVVMNMTYNPNYYPNLCTSNFIKSADLMPVVAVGLAAVIAVLLI